MKLSKSTFFINGQYMSSYLQYNRQIDFEDSGVNDFYKVTYPNGFTRLIYINISKSNRTELIEWYDDGGWLITYNEYCIQQQGYVSLP